MVRVDINPMLSVNIFYPSTDGPPAEYFWWHFTTYVQARQAHTQNQANVGKRTSCTALRMAFSRTAILLGGTHWAVSSVDSGKFAHLAKLLFRRNGIARRWFSFCTLHRWRIMFNLLRLIHDSFIEKRPFNWYVEIGPLVF